MRTYDKIIARILTISLICLGLTCLISLFNLEQSFTNIFLVSEFLILVPGSSLILVNIFQLRKERKLIHSRLDDLQSNGLRVYRKKFERLLYSRDIADLPKLGKLLYNFDVLAVLQPTDAKELKEIIKLCEEFNIPLIARGAGTGGYGGVLPIQNGIILILIQIKDIVAFDPETKVVEVEVGITWQHLREYLIRRGFDLYTYPSSAPSSSVGGWIASGGYGIGSSKYGDISGSIQKIILFGNNGEEERLDDSTDFIGNFGTIGIIWKATLKIRPITLIHHIAISPKSYEDGLEKYNLLENMNPYYLRYIDQSSLKWIEIIENLGLSLRDARFGIITSSYLEEDWINFQEELKNLEDVLPKEVADELWKERFYTLRLKRGGPSLIVSEVIVPSNRLNQFLELLSKYFAEEKYSVEIISVSNKKSMVMVWFPTDQRRWRLPLLGSIPYLFHWFKSFQVIKIAWRIGGSTYNNGGLWLSPYPNYENYGDLQKIRSIKKRIDPKNIFNPGKIGTSRIPRFFPVLSWSMFLKIGLPVASILYRVLPKRYR